MEFRIGKSITVSPNQRYNALSEDPATGYKIITVDGAVLYDIEGVYPIRQYQHTVGMCRVRMLRIMTNKHGEIYTEVYFSLIETKNNLLNAWDQLFTLDRTNSSAIDEYEASKEAFIPGASMPTVDSVFGRDEPQYPGHDSPYHRTVEEEEIAPRRANRNLPKDFWK